MYSEAGTCRIFVVFGLQRKKVKELAYALRICIEKLSQISNFEQIGNYEQNDGTERSCVTEAAKFRNLHFCLNR